jgi:hypothetical protein
MPPSGEFIISTPGKYVFSRANFDTQHISSVIYNEPNNKNIISTEVDWPNATPSPTGLSRIHSITLPSTRCRTIPFTPRAILPSGERCLSFFWSHVITLKKRYNTLHFFHNLILMHLVVCAQHETAMPRILSRFPRTAPPASSTISSRVTRLHGSTTRRNARGDS